MRYLFILSIVFSFNLFADSEELKADCKNRCAFNDLEKQCFGIYLKQIKGEKTNFLHLHHNELLDACVYYELYTPTKFFQIDYVDAQKLCDCEDSPVRPPAKDISMSERSRNELKQLKEKIKSWAACAPNPLKVSPYDPNRGIHYGRDQMQVCEEMEDPYLVLGACGPGTMNSTCRYHGNTNIFGGPFCMVGDEIACKSILMSQDPETGAWYRSAYQRRFPFSEIGQPLFSRDEILGVMMYLAKSKNKVAAKKYLNFIMNNPKKKMDGPLGKLGFKVYNLCPPHPGGKPDYVTDEQWENMKADDRCEVRPDTWGQLYFLYKYLGFSNSDLKKISKKAYRLMRLNRHWVKASSFFSSYGTPRFNYETKLQAHMVQLLRFINKGGRLVNGAAKAINRRSDFMSPYYDWLAHGNKPTEYGAYLIKKYCPETKPNYVNPPQGGTGVATSNYLSNGMHSFGGHDREWLAKLPGGRDCMALIDIYLQR
jgi:hypothetical protein